MTGQLVELNGSQHQTVQDLLPWFVLDTLGRDERALVQAHLQVCSLCRADIDFQRKMTALELPADMDIDVESAFAKLRLQLSASPSVTRHGALMAWLRKFWRGGNRPWMLAGQFAAIAVLCVFLFQPRYDAPYRGLGLSSRAAGNVVVVFRPQTTELELRRILQANGARIVDGPTVTDAYLLDIDAGRKDRALSLLRAEPAVALAESLESRSDR